MQKTWCYSSFLIFSHNPYLVHQQILLALLSKYIQNIIISPHLFCHYSGSSPNYFFLILPKELLGWSLPIPTSVTPSVTPLPQTTKGFLLIQDKATALHTQAQYYLPSDAFMPLFPVISLISPFSQTDLFSISRTSQQALASGALSTLPLPSA